MRRYSVSGPFHLWLSPNIFHGIRHSTHGHIHIRGIHSRARQTSFSSPSHSILFGHIHHSSHDDIHIHSRHQRQPQVQHQLKVQPQHLAQQISSSFPNPSTHSSHSHEVQVQHQRLAQPQQTSFHSHSILCGRSHSSHDDIHSHSRHLRQPQALHQH